MRDKLFRKGLVVGIIILFIGVGVYPAFAVDTKQLIIDKESEEEWNYCEVSNSDLIKVERLLNRVEVYSKLLLMLSRYNPEIKEKIKILSNEITIVNNKVNSNFSYCLSLFIQIAISIYLFTFFDLMHNELPEDSILHKIFLNLCHYYINKSEQLYDSGKDYDCWWWEPDPHP